MRRKQSGAKQGEGFKDAPCLCPETWRSRRTDWGERLSRGYLSRRAARMPLPLDDLSALAGRVRSGDRAAFERLFRALHPDLVRYGRSLADAAEADDAVQDAFLALWRRRDALDPGRSVRALLYAAVRHRLFNRHRDAARRRDLLDAMDAPDPLPAPDAVADAALLAGQVRGWLDALPDRQREAFGLSRFDGLSYAEVAGVMGCSVKTVENHIGRALQTLRAQIQRAAPDALLP